MCGRTSSARVPAVWIRQTGARRYIARQSYRAPQNTANTSTNTINQSTNQSINASHRQNAQQVDIPYSYNCGPHFNLPVLRYLNIATNKSNKRKHDQIQTQSINQSIDQSSLQAPVKSSSPLSSESATKRARYTSSLTPQQRAIEDVQTFLANNSDVLETAEIDAKFSPQKNTIPINQSVNQTDSQPSSSPASQTTSYEEPELVVESMRWGLIPSFTKADNLKAADAAQPHTMINARAETLPETKSYRHLLANNRCVVLVDLYYEWAPSTDKKKNKQPYAFQSTKLACPISSFDEHKGQTIQSINQFPIHPIADVIKDEYSHNNNFKVESSTTPNKHSLKQSDSNNTSIDQSIDQPTDESLLRKPYLMLAGLFDTWRDPSTNEDITTVTILTQSASQSLSWVHERQPVMLSDEQAHRWLRCDLYSYEECRPFTVKPSTNQSIEFYPCAPIVGNVRNQTPDCIMKADEYEKIQKSKGIARFFQPKAEAD